jgi:hypothetical protein
LINGLDIEKGVDVAVSLFGYVVDDLRPTDTEYLLLPGSPEFAPCVSLVVCGGGTNDFIIIRMALLM